MVLRLEKPSPGLEASYRGLIEELRAAGERPVPFPLGYPAEDFAALVSHLANDEKGIGLPEGFVSSSTYWLVRDSAEIVGVSNLRHDLTSSLRLHGGHIGYGVRPSARRSGYGREILRQTLLRARERGFTRVLVTCGKENVGSAKIITACGGALESEVFIPERKEVVQRYWIDLAVKA